MNRITIGIDPGMSGGIAVNYEQSGIPSGLTDSYPMPETEGDILALLSEIKNIAIRESAPIEAHVEQVPIGMYGRGCAMVKLNMNASFIRGCLMTLGIPIVMVVPVNWQKYFGVGKRRDFESSTEWKNVLKAEAQRRFPNLTVTLKTADALLILEHALKNFTSS